MSLSSLDSGRFNIVEASIEEHKHALDSGLVTSVELVVSYLLRIAKYDIQGGLNAFTVFNPKVFQEAQASDDRRTAGRPPLPLEGIPYTLKDSYKYEGMTVTNGSPALEGLMSNEDSGIAFGLRAAGAVLIGKTNMPPMACGGMQRGLYGRAESPYNRDYLTGAYSSGSSNGAATSTAANMAVFGMGSETVSSGRSPASNNALVVYTPSKGLLSCRGLWPLYVTCDVPTPLARSVKDLLEVLNVIAEPDPHPSGDFWRQQPHIKLPKLVKTDYTALARPEALKGKRVGVPKMYIGEKDSNPNAKPTTVDPSVIDLWHTARADLEALGAEVILMDFPLVTNYEDESICGEVNNVVGAPPNWSAAERGMIIAKTWDDFLKDNKDPKLSNLAEIDTGMIFPKPKDYVPDTFVEVKNLIDYASLPALAEKYKDMSVMQLPGMEQALKALEAQRKRDLEDWMDANQLDCIVFPAQGDAGKGDLEFNFESARQALQNGVKYSNGNRTIRHLGIPTVSVPMGVMKDKGMPMNLTFAGKAYEDEKLLLYAYAYEQGSKRRVAPPLAALETDIFERAGGKVGSGKMKVALTADVKTIKDGDRLKIHVSGTVHSNVEQGEVSVEVYLDGERAPQAKIEGEKWEVDADYRPHAAERLDWSLKPMPPPPVMVLVVARGKDGGCAAKVLWVKWE